LRDLVARYYAARAPEYDVSAGYTDRVAEQLRAPIKARFREALAGLDVLEVACGTGYWTEVIAATARSVVATDVNPGMVSRARARLASRPNVRCQVADAYSFAGVSGRFTAAFSHWWWSHVPTSQLGLFLRALHGKLEPGALVLFADQLPYEHEHWRLDAHGDRVEERTLQTGFAFEVVKNFPTEGQVRSALRGRSEHVVYAQYPQQGLWEVRYRTAEKR
jgi:SAM-dependent methyltransferase